VLPDLADADLWDLLTAVTSVAAGLHQVVHSPPTLAALYREDPQLRHANVEVAASLQRITEVILLDFQHRRAQRRCCVVPTQNRFETATSVLDQTAKANSSTAPASPARTNARVLG
jgi:Tetracyclin repressor-like, C-terminal domain